MLWKLFLLCGGCGGVVFAAGLYVATGVVVAACNCLPPPQKQVASFAASPAQAKLSASRLKLYTVQLAN